MMPPATNANEKSLIILLLMTMTLLGVFPLDVVLPSFPDLSACFQISPPDVALSVSLFAASLALSIMLVGPLSDMWGRKKLLLGGIAVATIGATGCAVSSEYNWFLGFRLVQAIGCGSFSLSQALVQDLFIGRERQRLRIWMVTAGGVFISISPLLGTWLQLQFGWQGSFYVFATLAVLVWLSACWLLKETPSVRPASRGGFFRAYRHVCSDARFMGYWLISALAFACHFSFIVTSPIIFMDHLAMSPYEFAWALLLYGIAYVFGGVVASLLHRQLQANTQINVGLGLIAVSGLLMLWLTHQFGLSAVTVLTSMLVCTIGTTITRPVVNTRAMSIHPEYAGTSTSVGGVLMFLSGGVVSAAISVAPMDLITTLASCFLTLSLAGLGLNALIIQRYKPAFNIG
ncbi:Inner membrane transport protein YdhC [Pseudomonas jessenii]|jgi:Bcr/CflA subfamily drug resistance transporter|uniref:Inner membrane transport protein YdhC n=2 Tax=Pseudomonas TaxID=286 RepID=A0A5E6V8Q8_PSEFL|nr:Inner membrane transport protein YdhC [Pseudomonas fluorescens]